jgi:hypothetical protein
MKPVFFFFLSTKLCTTTERPRQSKHLSILLYSETNKTMPTNSNDTSSNSNGHLIYTGRYKNGKITLGIQTIGCSTSTHFCNAFFPDPQFGRVIFELSRYSAPNILEEHGWFKDIGLFAEICEN